jgi:antitoxin (DNA-binding transcriptional repressor) of toxin-antitoxin stability system
MTLQVSFSEAKRRLRDLIDAAMRGETVVIVGEDQKSVQLVPVQAIEPHPQFGSAQGLVHISDDFDEPLVDFQE